MNTDSQAAHASLDITTVFYWREFTARLIDTTQHRHDYDRARGQAQNLSTDHTAVQVDFRVFAPLSLVHIRGMGEHAIIILGSQEPGSATKGLCRQQLVFTGAADHLIMDLGDIVSTRSSQSRRGLIRRQRPARTSKLWGGLTCAGPSPTSSTFLRATIVLTHCHTVSRAE
ncbi:hypothetical protein BDW22DRAFT_443557 [Trametopsis cervina]|nr:hypothetical protein BDW22DRAFT_443557 [Trametopsis cervina]